MSTREHAAKVIAEAQNVPFPGPKQCKIAQALIDARIIPTQPALAGVIDREAIARAAWTSYDGEQSWDELCALAEQKPDGDYADIRDGYLGEADRILTILPGRTVAQVKAEGLRELAATTHRMPADPEKARRWLNARADELEREDKR